MNKKDLIKYVSDKTLITEKDAGVIIDVVFEGLKKGILSEDRIVIQNFGSFFPVTRASRKAMHPQTGEKIDVPEKTVVKFKLSNSLYNKMNNV